MMKTEEPMILLEWGSLICWMSYKCSVQLLGKYVDQKDYIEHKPLSTCTHIAMGLGLHAKLQWQY